jgi:soluble lytic murein transglycosylase-like protein
MNKTALYVLLGFGLLALLSAGGALVVWQFDSRGKQYLPVIQAAAASVGLPWQLIAAELDQESDHFAPDVISGQRTSSVGAVGIAQFMPATAAQLGIDPTDPIASINAMAQYLTQIRNYVGFDSWTPDAIIAALAAYNWGEGNVKNAMASYGDSWTDNLPAETSNYLDVILGNVGQEIGVAWA